MTEVTPEMIAAVEAHQKAERIKKSQQIESEREQKLQASMDKITADFKALEGKAIKRVEVYLHKSYSHFEVSQFDIELDDNTLISYSYDTYDNAASISVGLHYMP